MHKQLLSVGFYHISSPTLDPTVKVPWIHSGTARAKMSLTKMFLESSRTRNIDTLNANLARSYVAAMS
jgi:hypothetical protein